MTHRLNTKALWASQCYNNILILLPSKSSILWQNNCLKSTLKASHQCLDICPLKFYWFWFGTLTSLFKHVLRYTLICCYTVIWSPTFSQYNRKKRQTLTSVHDQMYFPLWKKNFNTLNLSYHYYYYLGGQAFNITG